jgi:hypothetical protein
LFSNAALIDSIRDPKIFVKKLLIMERKRDQAIERSKAFQQQFKTLQLELEKLQTCIKY